MKRFCFWAWPVLFTIVFLSCKKTSDKQEDILKKKISDIIPQKYIDTLKKLGLQINEGANPPDIQGIYEIAPARLQATNRPNDVAIGYTFNPAKIQLFEQRSSDFTIKFFSKNLIGKQDTSLATAVSGSANNFTVYGKARATSGVYYADFGIIMTGSKDGNALKNVVYGIISIDNSHGGTVFIKEGYGRIFRDDDFVSAATNVFRLQQTENAIDGGVVK